MPLVLTGTNEEALAVKRAAKKIVGYAWRGVGIVGTRSADLG